jgi:hypothetical protein
MKKQGCLFASAIAAGLVAIAGKPAAADTCLTQPNLRADGGHWYYRIDRPTHRKCWYQQTPRTDARSTTSSPPTTAKSNGLSSWLSSFSTAVTRKTPNVGVQEEEAHEPRSAEPAPERSSRWRLRAARRGDADRARNRRANVERLRATQVDPDNSRALRAESDSHRQDVDPAVLRAAREDQDSFRVQSSGSNNARARPIEPEGSRTRGINPDNGRGAQVDPDDSQLNLIDLNGVHARSATSFTKGDRLQPKAVPTVAEPPPPQAPPQVSMPVQVKAGVSALDAAQREALFQEFLRTQERQWVRFW